MANPNQFDLNAEIQAWRDSVASSPEVRLENLNELESHLRDSIAALRDKGLTEAEAFQIATQRIGSPPALQPEFGKVNAREVWLDRLLWMVVGVQLWGLIVGFSGTASRLMVTWGLMTFGNAFRITPGDTWATTTRFLYPSVYVALLSFCIWLCLWLVRRGAKGPLARISRIARRPRSLGLLVALGTIVFVAIHTAGYAGTVLAMRHLSSQQAHEVSISATWAWTVISLAQTVALFALAGFLARRFFRNKTQRA